MCLGARGHIVGSVARRGLCRERCLIVEVKAAFGSFCIPQASFLKVVLVYVELLRRS